MQTEKEETQALSNILDHTDWIEITFHPKAAEYTFF